MYKIVWTIRVALCGVLAVAIIYTVMVWQSRKQSFGPVSSAIGVEEPVYSDLTGVPDPPVTYDALAQSDLFGTPLQKPPHTASAVATPTASLRPSDPIENRLGYSVIGTITGSRAIARATFTDSTQKSHLVCALGDPIGKATVVEIHADGVLLDFEGSHQRLDVKKKIAPSAPIPPPIPASNEPAPRKVTEVKRAESPMRERIAQIEAFLDTVNLTHYEVNGKVDGIQINNMDELPEAKRFGLKNGDVIRYVNGQHLSSKQKAFQVFKKARSQAFIDIELQRKGRNKQLSFRIK